MVHADGVEVSEDMTKNLAVLVLGVAAVYGVPAWAAGHPMEGKEKAATCAACHGADGNSQDPSNPRLAGQHRDYLAKALSDYKSGARKNAIMNGMAANLSKQDIADLAAYFSTLPPAIITHR
jgi:cytochrome c553